MHKFIYTVTQTNKSTRHSCMHKTSCSNTRIKVHLLFYKISLQWNSKSFSELNFPNEWMLNEYKNTYDWVRIKINSTVMKSPRDVHWCMSNIPCCLLPAHLFLLMYRKHMYRKHIHCSTLHIYPDRAVLGGSFNSPYIHHLYIYIDLTAMLHVQIHI